MVMKVKNIVDCVKPRTIDGNTTVAMPLKREDYPCVVLYNFNAMENLFKNAGKYYTARNRIKKRLEIRENSDHYFFIELKKKKAPPKSLVEKVIQTLRLRAQHEELWEYQDMIIRFVATLAEIEFLRPDLADKFIEDYRQDPMDFWAIFQARYLYWRHKGTLSNRIRKLANKDSSLQKGDKDG